MAEEIKFPRPTKALIEEYRTDPVRFIEEQCVLRNAHDGGRTWIRPTLYHLQRQVVTDVLTTMDDHGNPYYTTMLLSWARKMSKTILAAMMWVQKVVCNRNELILIACPTKTAATELAFTSICDVFNRNKNLAIAAGVVITKSNIKIQATESEIRATSSSLGAQAGADWTVCHVDELWAFDNKKLTEYYNTVTTPSPSRVSPLLCVTSYAPIVGRSLLLEKLIARSKKNEPKFYASIVSGVKQITENCPWITEEFLRQMKRTQPPKVFHRVFLNKPTPDIDDEDRYMFSRGQVSSVVDMSWSAQNSRPSDAIGPVVLGIDFAAKHDAAVVSALSRMKPMAKREDGENAQLANSCYIALLEMLVKHGSKKEPLAAQWVVEKVKEMAGRFGRVKIFLDPTGLTDQVFILRNLGFDVVEVNRKGIPLADALYRAISGQRIRLFRHAGMVKTFDGRDYSFEDELHNLMLDTDTQKMWHNGEGVKQGRHWDDRCTSIALALQSPELDLGNTQPIRGMALSSVVTSNSDARDSIGGRRFNGAPIRPGTVFAPVVLGPSGSRFGFRRNDR